MIYQFYCINENCSEKDKEIEFEAPIQEGPPKEPKCKCCGEKLGRYFSGSSIKIPDIFKAVGESESYSMWKTRMKKSRPSGRDKVYY